jgi:diguanylate cyclase (GGDEF)-like protein/PAS domain S-box-containing protein/putative nucleotidyltransferase with HDIG domain
VHVPSGLPAAAPLSLADNRPAATILVVDDDGFTRRLVVDTLTADVHLRIVEESDGARAIDLLGRDVIDAVVCDLVLPGADGLAVLEHVRALGDDAPAFLMLTGTSRVDVLSEALGAGAADYMRKPFEPLELRARVGAALRHREERRRMLRTERMLTLERDRLAASEIRSRSIVETAVDAIITIDGGGLVRSFNPAAERIFGWPADEVIGRNVSLLMPDPDHSRHGEYLRRYNAGGEASIIGRGREVIGKRKDGTLLHAHLSVGEMTIGGRRMFTGLLRDVTDRVRAEQELRRQHTYVHQLLNSVQDGIIVIGHEDRVLDVNERLCEMTGLSRDEVLAAGMPRPWWAPSASEAIANQWAHACLAGGAEFDGTYLNRAGETFPVIIGVSVLPDESGLATAHIAIVKDVTERHRQGRRLAQMVDEQASLRRVAEAVAHDAQPDAMFGMVASEVASLLGARAVTVWCFGSGRVFAVGSFPRDADADTEAGAAVAQVAATGEPARRALPDGIDVAWPVRKDGEVWGCLDVHGAAVPEPGAATEQEILQRFATLIELAVTSAEARRVLAERAANDHLTGLLNHRSFHERLQAEWERSVRHGRDLALVVMDIDNFKQVNDTFGHPTGDRVLSEFARRLRACGRAGDVLARVGGEEFAWLLPETDAADAIAMAERCRRAIAAEHFDEVGPITASLGVCDDGDALGPGEMYQLADEALYAAKSSGRDRVVRHTPGYERPHEDPEPRPMPPSTHPSVGGMLALARAVDAKDPTTRRHSGRVADLAVRLATALGWSPERCVLLRDAGLMHDVGKIAVPDAILLKPERLSEEEYAIVQTHAAIGAEIAAEVLTPEQASWVRHHHEQHDGGGYPDRIAGGDIPDGARILAVADAFDVMMIPRRYASGRTLDEALAECRRCSGSQFDPAVVDALVRLSEVGALLPDG